MRPVLDSGQALAKTDDQTVNPQELRQITQFRAFSPEGSGPGGNFDGRAVAGDNVQSHRQTIIGIVSVNSLEYVEALLNNLRAHDISVILRSEDDRDRATLTGVSEIVLPQPRTGWLHGPVDLPNGDIDAQIAFTSGTEGEPKGVVLTQRNLFDVTQRLNQAMGLDASIREYVGSPATYSFGYARFRSVLSAGGAAYMPPRGFDPIEIADMLRGDEINAISAVPTMWRLLLSAPQLIGELGRKVRWIEVGSQYMSRSEKEALKELFPNANIIQHYGLTEASRTTFLRVHEENGERLESVGRPNGNTEIKITDEGRVAVRGPHVASAYLIDGARTSFVDEDGWFHTNDLGCIDDDGYLTFLGRADDVINCGGIKINPEALETKLFTVLGIESGLAVCRIPDPLRGDGFLVAARRDLGFETELVQREVVAALDQFGISAISSIKIIEVDDLPRTATGKVQRHAIVEAYAESPAETAPSVSERKRPRLNLLELTLARNQMIVMLVSGLWHGAAWTFVSWGACHGFMLMGQRQLARSVGRVVERSRKLQLALFVPQVIFVFALLTASRVFFRSTSLGEAGLIFAKLWNGPYDWRGIDGKSTLAVCGAIIGCVLIAEGMAEWGIWRRHIAHRRVLRTAFAVATLLATLLIGEFMGGRFIYVRF
jgi:hypothetical protein